MENDFIEVLLARMVDSTTSWIAHREAEKLDDVELIPRLIERIRIERKKDIRRDFYFILGHIGRNTGDIRAAKALLSQLAVETDKYILDSLFTALGRQRILPSCSDIIPFTRDSRWLVRQTAISALGSCPLPEAEETLIAILNFSSDHLDLTYASAALGKIGTKRAIPALMRMLDASTEDVKTSSLAALTQIGDVSILPFLLKALANSNGHVKMYAMNGILRHGDERAIDPVIERVKQIVSRERKQEIIPSELVEALEFLLRYASTDKRITELVHTIYTKKLDRLFPEERKWLEAHRG